jgi:hypothetical protein
MVYRGPLIIFRDKAQFRSLEYAERIVVTMLPYGTS